MISPRFWCGLGLAAVLGLALCKVPFLPAADEPDKPTEPADAIQQTQPAFYVHADCDRPSREYCDGDSLTLKVKCEVEAYLYVIYEQADGKRYQIFPNSSRADNKVPAGEEVVIPGADQRFRWSITAPYGKEKIKVLASKKPLEKLSDKRLREKEFNPISREVMKGVGLEIDQQNSDQWSETAIEITTAARPSTVVAGTRRVGVFFGVSHHEFNDIVMEVTKDDTGLDRPAGKSDAETMERLFRDRGRLDDARVYVDEQATRQQMEQSIAEWLPSVSKPGDTVLIFFSGHGDAMAPYKPNDAHVRGCYLLPHDVVLDYVLVELVKRNKAGTLSPERTARLETILGWLKSAGKITNDDQLDQVLAYRSGVPDDVFGHWLQRLAGRQIIVILNACHSGGFAAEGKSLQAPTAAFDFLSPQLTRLKDLGQGETALLAACGSKEVTLSYHASDEELAMKGVVEEKVKGPLSVFTYYIAEDLLTAPAATKIEATYDHCTKGMATYIERLNVSLRNRNKDPITPYSPKLFNHCSKPVLIKP